MHGLKQTRGSVFFFGHLNFKHQKTADVCSLLCNLASQTQQEPWNSDNVRFGSNIRPDRSISFQSHLMLAHGLRQQSWPPRPTIWLVNLNRLHVLCRKPVETRCHRFQQEKNKPLRLQLFSRPLPQLLSKVLTVGKTRNLLKSGIQSVHNLPVRIAQPISTELEVVVLHWARKCWNLSFRALPFGSEGNIRRRGSNQHWFPCKFNNFNVFWGPKIWYTNLETHPCREL